MSRTYADGYHCREDGMTLREAQAQHAMYFHLWTLAHNCGMANQADHPRWRAALDVRDYCAGRMSATLAELECAIRETEPNQPTTGATKVSLDNTDWA